MGHSRKIRLVLRIFGLGKVKERYSNLGVTVVGEKIILK